MATTLATAFVKIMPDFRSFGGEMRQGLRRHDPEVTVDVNADTRGMHRQIDRESGAAGKRAGGLFSGGMAMGLAGAAAATAGVGAALGVAGMGIFKVTQKAGDLNETISKTEQIFGRKLMPGLMEFARTANRELGLTKTEALGATASFGDMFTQMGIGTDRAKNMSTSMVMLSSDLASFHNADITQVLEAQTAAFRGEYDSVQRFIPTLNAARVETEALRMTGKKNAEDLTAQDKALATHAIMYKDTAKAQGDFQRTSGGLANQQRILRAQWEELQTTLGQKFLPIVTKVVTFFNDLFNPSLDKGSGHARTLGLGVRALMAAFKEGDVTSTGFVGFMEQIGVALRWTWEKAKDLGVWLRDDLWPVLVQAKDDILPPLKEAWDDISKAFRGNEGDGQKLSGVLKALGIILTDAIIPFVSVLVQKWLPLWSKQWQVIGWGIHNVLVPALRFMTKYYLDQVGFILEASAKMFSWVPGVGDKLKTASREFNKFRNDVNNALDGIKDENINVGATYKGIYLPGKGPGSYGNGLGVLRRHDGGAVHGSGTGRSDSIPAMLSNGEHVWTAREVAAAGGHQAVMRLRDAVRGFASGGPVVRAVTPSASATAAFRNTVGARVERGISALHSMMSKDLREYDSLGSYSGPGGGNAGSLIAFGRWLQRNGYNVAEHPAFGGVRGVHTLGSKHYSGRAIDVNKGAGTSSREQAELRKIVGPAHAAGLRTLFMVPGHYNHLHADYDDGGWLPPGGRGMNLSRRPEPVFSAEQWEILKGNLSGGGTTVVLENHGVIGSSLELEDWLANGVANLQRKGRMPRG